MNRKTPVPTVAMTWLSDRFVIKGDFSQTGSDSSAIISESSGFLCVRCRNDEYRLTSQCLGVFSDERTGRESNRPALERFAYCVETGSCGPKEEEVVILASSSFGKPLNSLNSPVND